MLVWLKILVYVIAICGWYLIGSWRKEDMYVEGYANGYKDCKNYCIKYIDKIKRGGSGKN